MTDVSELFDTDINKADDEKRQAHIIDRGDDPRPAWSIVLEASIMGIPVTALCGYVWIPSRDPKDLPVCEKCIEMLKFAMDYRGLI